MADSLKKIAYGNSNFREIRSGGFFYLDKTRFIKDLVEDGAQTLIFTRPRRFRQVTDPLDAQGVSLP